MYFQQRISILAYGTGVYGTAIYGTTTDNAPGKTLTLTGVRPNSSPSAHSNSAFSWALLLMHLCQTA